MFVQGGLVKYQASQIHNNAMFGSDGGAPVLTNDVSLQVFMEYLNACKLKLLVQTGAPPSSPNMLGIIVGLWRVDFAQQKLGLWASLVCRLFLRLTQVILKITSKAKINKF